MQSKRPRGFHAYVCGWSSCGRKFSKREHLQRHERGHTGDARYECPTCKRRFVRRDVMTRHAALHGVDVRGTKKLRKVSCMSCAALKVRCDGCPGKDCSHCQSTGRECLYRGPNQRRSISSSGNADTQAVSTQSVNERNESAAEAPYLTPCPNLSVPSISRTPLPGYSARSHLSASGLPSNLSGMEEGNVNGLGDPPVSHYDFDIEMSDSILGWPLGWMDSESLDAANPCIPSTSSTDYSYAYPENVGEPATLDAPSNRESVSVSMEQQSHLIPDAQPADSPWPHVYRPSVNDTVLGFPSLPQESRSILHESHAEHMEEPVRDAMIAVIESTNNPQWSAVDTASFPSTRILSMCINLYFKHFHETLPIIRRATFRTSGTPPILLLAMAAVGAVYSHGGVSNLAIPLNEMTRRAISYLRENDRRAMFDISLTQAMLLQSVFGLFCGSRMLYQHAEISRGSLVTAARRLHLLRPNLSYAKELRRRKPSATVEELRTAYAKDEERCRLGWGIYLYDMQISCLFNIPPLLSVSEVNTPLPQNEDAETEFLKVAGIDQNAALVETSNFRCVLSSLLLSGKLQDPLNTFGLSLVALCTDASSLDPILGRPPGTASSAGYRLVFPPTFTNNPQKLLDKLSSSCFTVSFTPSSLLVNVSTLAHLAHMQFTWPSFLDNIKVAAGKSGTDESIKEAQKWLTTQISGDPVGARSIVVHAGHLSALLLRFTFDAPSETVWLLDAALTFWAIVKFGGHVGDATTPSSRTAIVTWTGSENVEEWTNNGGPISFWGLGKLQDLTPTRILTVFVERLENLPWGLSQQFRQVLLRLSWRTSS